MGSGKGFYLERWRELGAKDMSGSDLSPSAVGKLRERFPGSDFRTMDIGAPIPAELSGQFDAVSAFDVLFHIIEDDAYQQAFRNLSDLLRPGGMAVFSEYLLDSRTRRSEAWVKRSRGDTEAAVREAGLVQVRRTPMFFLMNPPAQVGQTLHRRAWRALAQSIRKHPRLGAPAGAALYPLEVTLGRLLSDGPSTHIVVCRKPA